MNVHEYRFLLADRSALRELLKDIPSEDVIDRHSLEGRLRLVEQELEAYEGFSHHLVNAFLTFGGRPVKDHHSIMADFGLKATKAFADAVDRVGASLHGPLAAMGPVPHRDKHELVITRMVHGSLGFELEAADTRPVLLTDEGWHGSSLGSELEAVPSCSQTNTRYSKPSRRSVPSWKHRPKAPPMISWRKR